MTYLCFTGAGKDLEIVLWGGGLDWGHQLRQDVSERQAVLVSCCWEGIVSSWSEG